MSLGAKESKLTTDGFKDIEKLEADLWEAADNLRANSKLTSSDYFMPVLGVIFLRHAANRFEAARKQIEEDQAAGRMPKRKVLPEDYIRRRALWLPEEARYDCKFSIQKAHDNGEFFTPSSLVTMIVNVIEPNHGIVFDPACASGGMFVQSSHFIEHEGGDTAKKVVFYGQEKNIDTIHLAKMNLAVHGLEGKIAGAITYYQDEHTLAGKCDFVMANPPFNVDLVDAERIKGDPRLPFGLPGVNKDKKVSNANYLWISYFWSYLSDKGRAGFVMSSQASVHRPGSALLAGRPRHRARLHLFCRL
jgi:type I restriction-modification system DNA methylase subunit